MAKSSSSAKSSQKAQDSSSETSPKTKQGDAQTRYLKSDKKTTKAKGTKPKSKTSDKLPKIDPKNKEESLRKIEEDLNNREVALIEREMKTIRVQEELDRLRPLSGLYRVVQSMAIERKLDALLETITRETQSMLKADRCSVFVVEASTEELWTQVAQGLEGSKTIRIPMDGTSIVAYCAKSREVINIPDAYKDERFDPAVDKQTGYRTKSVLCVPMLNRSGNIIGVFQVLNKDGGPFTSEDQEWLQALSAVAAGLIEQAQAYQEIEQFVDKTLDVLAQTIDKRDPLTAGHSKRVTNYSLLIGGVMDVQTHDVEVLRYSAMMHDYGKIGVPEEILWKNGRLTPEEYATVQTHARITFELLSNLPFTRKLQAVPYVASCHHEKLDGTGYYRGLKGDEIPFLSRIIAVADVFDALTSVRHYRNRMPIDKVYEILSSGKDNHFEPDCVDAFLDLPCHNVLTVMETAREQTESEDIDRFRTISWRRLVELVSGSKPKRGEDDLKETFERIYNRNLPKDYKWLD